MSNLKEMCKPIADYLRRNADPYTEVVITAESVTVKQSVEGMPMGATDKAGTEEGLIRKDGEVRKW